MPLRSPPWNRSTVPMADLTGRPLAGSRMYSCASAARCARCGTTIPNPASVSHHLVGLRNLSIHVLCGFHVRDFHDRDSESLQDFLGKAPDGSMKGFGRPPVFL